jgi:hypothetical protein
LPHLFTVDSGAALQPAGAPGRYTMLRGSWTHAPARMMVGLAVVFALAASAALEAAADAPPPAVQPPAALPSAAPSPADAAPPEAPPPSERPPAPPTELDGPAPRVQAGTGGSTQSGMTGCAVWTDHCVICQRDSGVVACSNIGIACQPQPLMCLRPEAAPEKKPEN